MNYIFILIETIVIFLLMLLFYKFGKKDGLFLYISFMAILLCVFMFKSIDMLSFEVDLGVPFIVGIFLSSNIIVQRYGIDEVKRIIKSFAVPYLITVAILSLVSLIDSSQYNNIINDSYNGLFGYDLNNIRLIVGGFLSIGFTLWYNCYIYYYIRKNKNKYLFSNIGSMLIIQFAESILFVIISYVGVYEFNILFGMIVIRYLLKIVMGLISLFPFDTIMKMKS